MAYFKNIHEMVNGACPDDDCEFIELDDCVTFEEFDLFATAELTGYLEILQESTDSCDKDKAETIVNVLRKRGCNLKPNRIEDAEDWELEEYYSMDELKKYKDHLWNELAARAAVLGDYLNCPSLTVAGFVSRLEKEIAMLSKRNDAVYRAWRKKAVAQEIANGNTLIAK